MDTDLRPDGDGYTALDQATVAFQEEFERLEHRLLDLHTQVFWRTGKDGRLERRFGYGPVTGSLILSAEPARDDPELVARANAMSPLRPELAIIHRQICKVRLSMRFSVRDFYKKLTRELGLTDRGASYHLLNSLAFSDIIRSDAEFSSMLSRHREVVSDEVTRTEDSHSTQSAVHNTAAVTAPARETTALESKPVMNRPIKAWLPERDERVKSYIGRFSNNPPTRAEIYDNLGIHNSDFNRWGRGEKPRCAEAKIRQLETLLESGVRPEKASSL